MQTRDGRQYCDQCGRGLLMSWTCDKCSHVFCDFCSGLTPTPGQRKQRVAVQTLGGGTPRCPQCTGGAARGNLDHGAIIVFGPEYAAAAASLHGDPAAVGFKGRYFTAEKAADLGLPDRRLGTCTLMFAHYVPRRRGRQTAGPQFEAWGRKLLNRMRDAASLGPAECGNPEIDWFCDGSSGTLQLVMVWRGVSGLLCRHVAQALEQAFYAQGGRSAAESSAPARPWWKFW